jgi:heat shock protein HslJ
MSGGAQPCFLGPNDDQDLDPTVDWLDGARRFRGVGERRELLGADGSVLATLVPATLPSSAAEVSNIGPDPTAAPADPGDLPDLDADPAPLPAGLRAATRADLLGRWVPEGRAGASSDRREPHVDLDADGTWSGSDGCNGAGGAWTSDDGGTILALSGASTLIGCENHEIGSWLAGAASAGFDGDTLLLTDFAGHELGRVERDRA